jgi:serine/threonine-protein kinase
MATVYRSRDLRHDRTVAIKVPRRSISESVDAGRFLREIRTTARLQHPHLLPLYDSGEANGTLFYVMPFVEGESLGQRIEREGPMAVGEAIRLTREVADALSYAHGQGLIHRDIKPANILISNNHAVVTDFGVARAMTPVANDRLTVAGERTGTAQYMSPEQAAGDENLDGRSDIFSLACMLFEMLAGTPPFTGDSRQAVIAKRFMGPPPSVRDRRPQVPYRIDAAIRTAMALEPKDRFQSAARFADALGAVGPMAGSENVEKSIAVLPFANMSTDPDAEFLTDGITEDLLNALVRLPGLRVIARTSSFALKGTSLDVREIGERMGVGIVLEGSVRKSGSRLRISARLVDARAGHQLWSERYDREMRDVFVVQDEITTAIRDALSERLLGLGPVPQKALQPIDSETYELFLRGRFFVAKRAEGMQKGMQLLAEAVTRAPAYAPAYAELASAYSISTLFCAVPPSVGWPKVRDLAHAALQLDPRLARAHGELGNVAFWYDWDWGAAKEHYERAIALDPNDPWLDALLGHYLASIGQHEESIEHGERARSLDPLNPSVSASLATLHFLAGAHQDTIAVCDRIIDQDSTFSDAYRLKGAALRELGHPEKAAPIAQAAVRFSGEHPWAVSLAGMVEAAAGRRDAALQIVHGLIERHQRQAGPFFVPPLAIALVFSQLDDPDSYFEWMERALEARDGWMVMLESDHSYDRHRSDPRHAGLVERVGIPDVAGVSMTPALDR